MRLATGSRFGPYDILAFVGAGGMGEVYRAHDRRLKRDVALKVLPDRFSRDPARLARFQREAELLARLNHTNIAVLYGLEQTTDATAIILEFVGGPTLANVIASGPLSQPDVFSVARQIADALKAAHTKGVVHRDLKPSNIKMTADGQVKVLDFGLAKPLHPGSARVSMLDGDSSTVTSPDFSTAAGVIVGTVGYMSPEQVRGEEVDQRADIWAFGCVLYEMLTTRNPFSGDTWSDTLASILTRDPDWAALPATIPSSIHRLMRRCLVKDQNERLADIGDAYSELVEPFTEHRLDRTPAETPSRSVQHQHHTAYVTIPPLPTNYVPRTDDLDSLRDILLDENPGRHVAITALQGMGGIGKTVLAQALCHDPVVEQAFPDGVIWITVGKEPIHDFLSRMREVGKALHDDLTRYDNELGSINQYRSTLREKAALIVLDDVWTVRDVEVFLAESSRSRVLFTTRDASIAVAVNARQYSTNLATNAQARALLAAWSGCRDDSLPSEAAALINECGGLPLALSMAGAMLRGKPPAFWSHLIHLLREADLEKIAMDFANYAHPSLFRAMQVSVNALPPTVRERYLALAILLEDMVADPLILRCLWDTDEFETLDTSERLVQMSLAQRSGDGGAIRLHDLQLDYARRSFADRDALALIHDAVRLSAHLFVDDPTQFVSQITGRLILHERGISIRKFVDSLTKAASHPWLRSLQPALIQAGGFRLRSLKGHVGVVWAVAISADGRCVVSASRDRTVRVWDVATGRERHVLPHSDEVSSVAIAPDGRWAISGSGQTLTKWDLETGRAISTSRSPEPGNVTKVVVTGDGQRALFLQSGHPHSWADPGHLRVWEIDKGEQRALIGNPAPFTGVSVSGDGKRAITSSQDGRLTIWDIDSGREVRTLMSGAPPLHRVTLSTDGRRAITQLANGSVRLLDLDTGNEIPAREGSPDSLSAMLAHRRQWAVFAQWLPHATSRSIGFWDLDTGEVWYVSVGLESFFASDLAVSADGRIVASTSAGVVPIWEIGPRRQLAGLDRFYVTARYVAASADGRRAVSLDSDTLTLWDAETGTEQRTMKIDSFPMEGGLALSADGRRAVCGDQNKLRIWDVDRTRSYTVRGHSGLVTDVALSSNGHRAVSACTDMTLKVWELEVGIEPRTLLGHAEPVHSVAMSADGRRVVSASDDGILKLWDADTGTIIRSVNGNCHGPHGVVMSHDGRLVIFTDNDGALRVWDTNTALELRVLERSRSDRQFARQISSLALSSDARMALSSTVHGNMTVWSLETGQALATFVSDYPIWCCAFGGSRSILAATEGAGVHFLRLEQAPGTMDSRRNPRF